jgi:hypothetical protein
VWWVHKDINKIKYNLLLENFIKLCKLVIYPIKQQNNIRNIKEIYRSFWKNIKYNAKKRNINFKIDQKYAINLFKKQKGLCKITGQAIVLPKNSYEYNNKIKTASLDRIDNNKSYQKRNLQWVHKIINQSRKNLDLNYYKYLCELVYKYSIEKGGVA